MARHLDSLGFTVFAGCLDTASFPNGGDGGCNDDDHDGNDVDDDFAGQRRCPEIEGRGWASSPPGLSRLLNAFLAITIRNTLIIERHKNHCYDR